MTSPPSAQAIDELLPQTQCTRCGYAGCRPYADAIANGEADINQCPPGGTETILALAALTGRAVAPLNPDNGIEAAPAVAFIDEERCIGCTRCLPPCPVDAIVGCAAPHAHGGRRSFARAASCASRPARSIASAWCRCSPAPHTRRWRCQPPPPAAHATRLITSAARAAPRSGPRSSPTRNAGRVPDERRPMNPQKRREIFERFRAANPHPTTELEYQTPFELLVARDPVRAGHRQERECGNP